MQMDVAALAEMTTISMTPRRTKIASYPVRHTVVTHTVVKLDQPVKHIMLLLIQWLDRYHREPQLHVGQMRKSWNEKKASPCLRAAVSWMRAR